MRIIKSEGKRINENEVIQKMNYAIDHLFNRSIFSNETFVCSDIFNNRLNQFSAFFITTHVQEDIWNGLQKLAHVDSGEGIYFHQISPKSCRECLYVSSDLEFSELLKDEEVELYLVGSTGGMDYLIFSPSDKWAFYSSKNNVCILAFTEEIRQRIESLFSPYIEGLEKIADHLNSIGLEFSSEILMRYEVGYFNPEPA